MTREEKLDKMLTSGYIIRSSIDLVGFASACALVSACLPNSMLSSSSKPVSDADVASKQRMGILNTYPSFHEENRL